MLEAPVEAYFVKRVIALGGFSLKTDRVQGRRFLDRTAFLTAGRVVVAELKRPQGGRRAKLQEEQVKWLLDNHFEAAFCKTKDEVDILLDAGQVVDETDGLRTYIVNGVSGRGRISWWRSTPKGFVEI